MLPENIIQVNTTSNTDQRHSIVVSLEGGGTVVVWWDTGNFGQSPDAVRAQLLDASGDKVGTEILVENTAESDLFGRPAVTALTGGGFAVAWSTLDLATFNSEAGYQVKRQIFNALGQPQGTEFAVNSDMVGEHHSADLASTSSDGFVVVWTDHPENTGNSEDGVIRAQFFDTTGSKTGSEIQISTRGDDLRDPEIILLSNGNYLVTWVDLINDFSSGLSGQIISPTGAAIGPEFVISNAIDTVAGEPHVAALSTGGFAVTWVDNGSGTMIVGSIMAQIFNADGSPLDIPFEVDFNGVVSTEVVIVGVSDGQFVVGYSAESRSEPGRMSPCICLTRTAHRSSIQAPLTAFLTKR